VRGVCPTCSGGGESTGGKETKTWHARETDRTSYERTKTTSPYKSGNCDEKTRRMEPTTGVSSLAKGLIWLKQGAAKPTRKNSPRCGRCELASGRLVREINLKWVFGVEYRKFNSEHDLSTKGKERAEKSKSKVQAPIATVKSNGSYRAWWW